MNPRLILPLPCSRRRNEALTFIFIIASLPTNGRGKVERVIVLPLFARNERGEGRGEESKIPVLVERLFSA